MKLTETDIPILRNFSMLIRMRRPGKVETKIAFVKRGRKWIRLGSGIIHKTVKIDKNNVNQICKSVKHYYSPTDATSLKEKVKTNKFACAIYFKSVEWAEDGEDGRVHPDFCPINMDTRYGIANGSVTHTTHSHSKLKGKCPDPNLRSTADHFLDYLKPADYARLNKLFYRLPGATIRIATTCSGGDVVVTAWHKTIEAMNARFDNLVT